MRLNIIYLKGLKGQFKLSKSFYPQPANVKQVSIFFIIQFNQFLRMVEKYGDLFHPKKLLSKQENYFLNMCDKLPQVKLHLKFCKYILGVSSNATTLAVRGETGRYPILIQILANMFKYLIQLKMSSTPF